MKISSRLPFVRSMTYVKCGNNKIQSMLRKWFITWGTNFELKTISDMRCWPANFGNFKLRRGTQLHLLSLRITSNKYPTCNGLFSQGQLIKNVYLTCLLISTYLRNDRCWSNFNNFFSNSPKQFEFEARNACTWVDTFSSEHSMAL